MESPRGITERLWSRQEQCFTSRGCLSHFGQRHVRAPPTFLTESSQEPTLVQHHMKSGLVKSRINLYHLRTFGCDAYLHIPKERRGKFDPKSTKCKLVGYCDTQKGYRLSDPLARKVLVIGRDAVFNEEVNTPNLFTDSSFRPMGQGEQVNAEEFDESCEPEIVLDSNKLDVPACEDESAGPGPTIDYPQSQRHQPSRWCNEMNSPAYATPQASSSEEIVEPDSYEEAVVSPGAKKWKQAK